jgi:hypothetical protein
MTVMMIFNMSSSYFHKISFHYFEDYLMTQTDLRVRYTQGLVTKVGIPKNRNYGDSGPIKKPHATAIHKAN